MGDGVYRRGGNQAFKASWRQTQRLMETSVSTKSISHKSISDTSKHGTIIRTGITCKKILCYMRDSACRWFIVENAKIFRSYVKHF